MVSGHDRRHQLKLPRRLKLSRSASQQCHVPSGASWPSRVAFRVLSVWATHTGLRKNFGFSIIMSGGVFYYLPEPAEYRRHWVEVGMREIMSSWVINPVRFILFHRKLTIVLSGFGRIIWYSPKDIHANGYASPPWLRMCFNRFPNSISKRESGNGHEHPKRHYKQRREITITITMSRFDISANTFISFINNVLIYRLLLWYNAETDHQRLLALGLQR